MGHLGFLFAAFAIAWVVLFAYTFFLNRSVRELRDELRALMSAEGEVSRERASRGADEERLDGSDCGVPG